MSAKQARTEINKLVTERNNNYKQLYDLLAPVIMDKIQRAEHGKRHIWDVSGELEEDFGIQMPDYERVINQMINEKIIMKMPTTCNFGWLMKYKETDWADWREFKIEPAIK